MAAAAAAVAWVLGSHSIQGCWCRAAQQPPEQQCAAVVSLLQRAAAHSAPAVAAGEAPAVSWVPTAGLWPSASMGAACAAAGRGCGCTIPHCISTGVFGTSPVKQVITQCGAASICCMGVAMRTLHDAPLAWLAVPGCCHASLHHPACTAAGCLRTAAAAVVDRSVLRLERRAARGQLCHCR